MDRVQVQIIGGGKMGEALVVGLLRADPGRSIRVVETDPTRVEQLRSDHPSIECAGVPGEAEGTVIAVKPQHVATAVAAAAAAGGGRVLSIAAGVTTAAIEAAAGPSVAVVRAMPNTPSLVGAGAAALAPGASADAEDLDWAESVLGSVGLVVRVGEPQLDAVTGLSGSGPAYVFLVLEALIDAGVTAGLPRDVAEQLAGQTVAGAAALFQQSGDHPAVLRAAVTSPGGTTAAGMRVLEERGTRSAFIDAVLAARDRSTELG